MISVMSVTSVISVMEVCIAFGALLALAPTPGRSDGIPSHPPAPVHRAMRQFGSGPVHRRGKRSAARLARAVGLRADIKLRSGSILLLVGACCFFVTMPAYGQTLSLDLSGTAPSGGMTGRIVQLTVLITVLSLAPSLLVTLTAFTRIIIVLSLLRSALGAQGTPPNPVLIGLALFLTFFVMEPTFDQAWSQGIVPMMNHQISELDGLSRTASPFHHFMAITARPADVSFFLGLGHMPSPVRAEDIPWRALAPAFMVGELRRAFEMGFLLYLPFLVIDVVVSSVLMSLGMMMLPPSAISLPFKLIFFVLIDGWRLVAGSLVDSFSPT